MPPNLLQSFLESVRPKLRTATPKPPLPTDASMGALISRMWELALSSPLPLLTDEEFEGLTVLLDPELRAIGDEMCAILRRRPDLGEGIGTKEATLQMLLSLLVSLEDLHQVAQDVSTATDTAFLSFRGALGAFTAKVLSYVQGYVADERNPVGERQKLLFRFQGALAEDERISSAKPMRLQRSNRRISALRERIEAMNRHKEVLAVARKLRGALTEGGAR